MDKRHIAVLFIRDTKNIHMRRRAVRQAKKLQSQPKCTPFSIIQINPVASRYGGRNSDGTL